MEKLLDTFKKVYRDEIKSRVLFESEVKNFYMNKGLPDYEQRALSHFSMMEDRNEIDEVAFQCKFCTDFCYFSIVDCKTHSEQPAAPQKKDHSKETKQQRRKRMLQNMQNS